MAIYYVSKTGADTNSGLTTTNAFLTITKAVNTMVSGDTTYIAPGTYRELVVMAQSGTALIGDPYCKLFTTEQQGYIRITSADANEQPSTNQVNLNLNAKDYCYFKHLNLDGTAGATAFAVRTTSGTANNNLFEYCSLASTYCHQGVAGYYTTYKYCQFFGGHVGALYTKIYNSMIIAGRFGASNSYLYNNIIIGGVNPAVQCFEVFDNITIGGAGGITTTTNTCSAINNLIIGAEYGLSCTSGNLNPKNNQILACYQGFLGSVALPISAGTTKYAYLNSLGTATHYTGTPTASKHIGFNDVNRIEKLAEALRMNINFEYDWRSGVTYTDSDKDILGNPRATYGGTGTTGCMAFSDISLVNSEYKINKIGNKSFTFNIKKDIYYDFSLELYYSGSTLYPEVVFDGEGITTTTLTATKNENIYLMTCLKNTVDSLIKINIKNLDPSGYLTIKGIKIKNKI